MIACLPSNCWQGLKKIVVIPTKGQKIAETSNRFVSKILPTRTFTFQEKITFLKVVNYGGEPWVRKCSHNKFMINSWFSSLSPGYIWVLNLLTNHLQWDLPDVSEHDEVYVSIARYFSSNMGKWNFRLQC